MRGCVAKGNSLSLSGVCDDRGQHAADTAAAREPGMEETRGVGKFRSAYGYPSACGFFSFPVNPAVPIKGSLAAATASAACWLAPQARD